LEAFALHIIFRQKTWIFEQKIYSKSSKMAKKAQHVASNLFAVFGGKSWSWKEVHHFTLREKKKLANNCLIHCIYPVILGEPRGG